ncbi:MAG: DUF2799 domain-containing protein [Proteobacteria bacterium]|nr:MAG: DUF2799 domain-containing protein [Pseudomonadota bacterium]
MKNLVCIIALVLLASGCTSMSKKDCETANWTLLGVADAEAGYSIKNFKMREEQCREYSSEADREKYIIGFADGAQRFCTYESGQSFAKAGKQYQDSCPSELEPDFLNGYKLGAVERKQVQLEAELKKKERELEDKKKKARDLERELEAKKKKARDLERELARKKRSS